MAAVRDWAVRSRSTPGVGAVCRSKGQGARQACDGNDSEPRINCSC